DDEIAERSRLAEKRLALGFLFVGQVLLLVVAIVDLALQDTALAGSARAVAAAVGQHEVLPQRRGDDRFAFLDLERVAVRLNGNLMHKMRGSGAPAVAGALGRSAFYRLGRPASARPGNSQRGNGP